MTFGRGVSKPYEFIGFRALQNLAPGAHLGEAWIGPGGATSTPLRRWALKGGLVAGGVRKFCVFAFGAILGGRPGPRLCQNVTQNISF